METAYVPTEFEVEITGQRQPAEPDVGIMSSYYEVDECVGLWLLKREFDLRTRSRKYHRINLLDGVNLRSSDVQKVLANILDALGDDAVCEAFAEAAE